MKEQNMKITQADVGRQVILRNGDVVTILRWDQSDAIMPIMTSTGFWYEANGKRQQSSSPEYEIVAFADDLKQAEESARVLRDQFAMAALTGLISHAANLKVKTSGSGYKVIINMPPEVAISSYEYADAMLKAREGK